MTDADDEAGGARSLDDPARRANARSCSCATPWPDADPPARDTFTLEIGLEDFGARQDDVAAEIDDQLDGYGASARQDPDGPVILTLTVPAADLWLSLLLAMAAVTRTGYSPRFVEAMPTTDYENRRRRRRALPSKV